MKYTFSFKEVSYGSVTIESNQEPDSSEVIDAIINGDTFIKDTDYEDISLDEVETGKPDREKPYER